MMRRGIYSLAGLAALILHSTTLQAETPAAPPDFKEVYDLLQAHGGGLSQPQLDRAAVQALITALAPKVMLVSNDAQIHTSSNIPLVSKIGLFDGDIGYMRISAVEEGLPDTIRKSFQELASTNKLKGLILDLRFAPGSDYAAAAGVADLFLNTERALLDWGKGVTHSKAKSDALSLPVAALVNHPTSGAAEALAAVLRETGIGIVLGDRTAGQAMIAQDFPLKNGERLRIATAPIHVGDGKTLSAEGVNPDISVRVGPEEELAYYADAFRNVQNTNLLFANAGLSFTNQPSGTNRTRRARFNEAELIRERREGPPPEAEISNPRDREPEKPVVHDPALARALDVLKGLAVVRQLRS